MGREREGGREKTSSVGERKENRIYMYLKRKRKGEDEK